MNSMKLTVAAGVLALGLATLLTPGNAQGPLYDQVNVTLPYSVTIGDRTLQPGDYRIRQLPSAGGSNRVLLIYSDQGMKFETSALTIPALDNQTPEDTKVVLHHFGPDYYFDKIWIQGKNYGYEFPLPDSVKARQSERMEPSTVAARYEAVPDTTATAESTTTESATTTAQTTTPAPSETATAQSTTPAPAETTTTPAPAEPTTTAQNTTPPPAPVDTAPPATTTPRTVTSDRTETADRTMPETAANWLTMLLGGGLLSGAGLALRRKR